MAWHIRGNEKMYQTLKHQSLDSRYHRLWEEDFNVAFIFIEKGNGLGESFFFFLAFCRVFVELMVF